MINMRLVVQRGITEEAIKEIIHRYEVRKDIALTMEHTDDSETLKILFRKWTDNEYALQSLWKFDEDARYHKGWYVPKCTCPKLDNDDNYPSRYTIRDVSCPVHGEKI